MRVQNEIDVHNVMSSVQHTARASDKIIGAGPIGIGLDGILTWVPGVGELYTLGASAYLLAQAHKARVPGIVFWQMTALLLVDLSFEAVPIAGALADSFFCAHLWTAWLLKRAILNTVYVTAEEAQARTPRVAEAIQGGKHIVILPGA